jgi:tRNA (Thr-GGU) A37 N-methylase
LDIKPYVPAFDAHPDAKAGWLTGKADYSATIRSDDRFIP